MSDTHSRRGEFCHVAENLYRYSSSGIYYARYPANGKEVSRSLRTADRTLAKRRLAEELENASRLDVTPALDPRPFRGYLSVRGADRSAGADEG